MTGRPAMEPLDYEIAKIQVRSDDAAVRRKLATRPDLRPEMLFYLATDASDEVRREVATNDATPRQADLLLAGDRSAAVRETLAAKIARLVPELPTERHSQIERMALDILERLARDQAVEVRRVLAEALKDVPTIPAHIVNRLARDLEITVAAPVLEHSPVLTDDVLLEIIASAPIPGALGAIARRRTMGSAVAEAIAVSDDVMAITALLDNPCAQIREDTLDRLIDQAPTNEPWHGPMVRRPKLPIGAAGKLARFIADSLLDALAARKDLDPQATRDVAAVVRARLAPPSASVSVAAAEADGERPADRARRLANAGKLDEETMAAALSEGQRAFVTAGLGALAKVPPETVERVLSSGSPRGVTALVWKADLSMRFALQVQLRLAQIPPRNALNPRHGIDYPLSRDELAWQLKFFGVMVA